MQKTSGQRGGWNGWTGWATDAEIDAREVWVPPSVEPKMWLPAYPCEHCGWEYWHIQSSRCMNCGRRATTNANGEFVRGSTPDSGGVHPNGSDGNCC